MKDVKIKQIYSMSNEMRRECCHIADMAGGDMENIYSTIYHDVNELGDPMFAYTIGCQLYGFIKGRYAPIPDYTNFARGLKSSKIDWLYVYYRNHRTGIGAMLLEAYTDYARTQGVQSLYLYSAPTMQSKDFYNKNGFEIIGWNNLMGKLL